MSQLTQKFKTDAHCLLLRIKRHRRNLSRCEALLRTARYEHDVELMQETAFHQRKLARAYRDWERAVALTLPGFNLAPRETDSDREFRLYGISTARSWEVAP